jgi:hypothetical protein
MRLYVSVDRLCRRVEEVVVVGALLMEVEGFAAQAAIWASVPSS